METEYIINPSLSELNDFCLKSKYTFIRGFYIKDENKYIFGDGYYITHDTFDKNIGKETIHLFCDIESNGLKIYPVISWDLYNKSCLNNTIYYLSNLCGDIYKKCKNDYYDKIILNKNDVVFYKEFLSVMKKYNMLDDFIEYMNTKDCDGK